MMRMCILSTTRREKITALIERFDAMRGSGIMSPTTGGLLKDAQALLEEYAALEEHAPQYRAVYPAQLLEDSEMEIAQYRDELGQRSDEQAQSVVRYVNKRAETAGLKIRGRVEKRDVLVGEWVEDDQP